MNSLNWEKCVLSAGLNVKLLPVHHHLICKSNWLSLPPVFYLHSSVFQRKRLLHMIGIRVPTRWWIYWGWFVYFRIVFLNIKLKEAGDLCSHWIMIFISWPDSAASQPPAPSCATDCWRSSSAGHRPGQRTRREEDRVYTTDLLIWDERLLIISLCAHVWRSNVKQPRTLGGEIKVIYNIHLYWSAVAICFNVTPFKKLKNPVHGNARIVTCCMLDIFYLGYFLRSFHSKNCKGVQIYLGFISYQPSLTCLRV